MAPEYALEGLISIKSDVYSFGILILEILSGKKNRGVVYHSDGSQSLLSYVSLIFNIFFSLKASIEIHFSDGETPSTMNLYRHGSSEMKAKD